MQISTTKLQEMMTKAMKGVGNNKLIPITSLIAIELKSGKLTMTTTDATNYVYVSGECDGDNMYVTVEADILYKLVSKFNCETVTLEVNESSLVVKGNGTYKIAIPFDEDGNVVKYPNPLAKVDGAVEIGKLDMPTIREVLTSVKPSLLSNANAIGNCYSNYHFGNYIMATDSNTMSAISKKLFTTPQLISATVMNLLGVCTSDILVTKSDNRLVFTADDMTVYTTEPEGIEDFNIAALTAYIEQSMTSTCKISTSALSQLLDRISLFVGAYDNGQIELKFTSDGLYVTSRENRGAELISYTTPTNVEEYTCYISVIDFAKQIKAIASDIVTIGFGSGTAIKLVDGEFTSVISLMD